jgi:hypothetical protein
MHSYTWLIAQCQCMPQSLNARHMLACWGPSGWSEIFMLAIIAKFGTGWGGKTVFSSVGMRQPNTRPQYSTLGLAQYTRLAFRYLIRMIKTKSYDWSMCSSDSPIYVDTVSVGQLCRSKMCANLTTSKQVVHHRNSGGPGTYPWAAQHVQHYCAWFLYSSRDCANHVCMQGSCILLFACRIEPLS